MSEVQSALLLNRREYKSMHQFHWQSYRQSEKPAVLDHSEDQNKSTHFLSHHRLFVLHQEQL